MSPNLADSPTSGPSLPSSMTCSVVLIKDGSSTDLFERPPNLVRPASTGRKLHLPTKQHPTITVRTLMETDLVLNPSVTSAKQRQKNATFPLVSGTWTAIPGMESTTVVRSARQTADMTAKTGT